MSLSKFILFLGFNTSILITGSRYVLEQILSGEATENVVSNIHEYLTTIGENVREGKTKIDDFIVFKVCFSPSSSRMMPKILNSATWKKSRGLP
jgi:hypothetical protein